MLRINLNIKELLFLIILEISLVFNEELNGVYNIKQFGTYNKLTSFSDSLDFRTIRKARFQIFRITPINSGLYKIESISSKKKIGINQREELFLVKSDDNTYWNIIHLNDSSFIIQNNSTKKYVEIQSRKPKCTKILEFNPKDNETKIENSLKFSLFKLYDEVELKPEYNKYIEDEPVDVVIKYIDLTDLNLKREGIIQTVKDEDHEELRYCLRSIFDNIPWIRKIFILMPNEKVRYLKPIEEIKDKIVYVKDKDLLGFDSANSIAFQLILFNLSQFGLADNFILMDDDYFIGKPINKSQFFYYDENEQKVVPNIISDEFTELVLNDVNNEYNKLFKRLNKIDPHTCDGWKFHTFSVYKLLLENFGSPLADGGFTHNAISLNTKDLKEIYEFIKIKYEHFNETFYSKIRPVYALQAHTLFNTYLLNVKKRRVNTIPRVFIDLKDLKKTTNLNIELYVINTSGENKYKTEHFENEKKILENKYNKPSPYEITDENKLISTFKYFKRK